MPEAQLHEIYLEFHRCTVYGEVDAQGRLNLHLCGHGMTRDDVQDAREVVSWLTRHGNEAERPKTCVECHTVCGLGCIVVPRTEALSDQIDTIMRAVGDVTGAIGIRVELTFQYADKQYTFSAPWQYHGGGLSPGGYYLSNTWTYFKEDPTEQLLAMIQGVPGVSRVRTEEIPATGSTALDIVVSSSSHNSLEKCLSAVTEVVAL